MMFEAIVSQAKTVAKSIFDIDIRVKISNNAESTAPGQYVFQNDTVHLFKPFIKNMFKKYGNLNKIIEHTISHEYGHAQEARLFSNLGYYPYFVLFSPNAVINKPILIPLKNELGAMREHVNSFLNGIDDFTIDKKLHTFGLFDFTARNKVENMKQEIKNFKNLNCENKIMKQILCLFSLPTYVNHYKFGYLENREVIKEFVELVTGPKTWKYVYEILEKQVYGQISVFNNSVTLLQNLFGLSPKWKIMLKKVIEKKASIQMPKFWNHSNYFILYIE